MKTVELHLPYFKQGDDLGFFLEKCKNPLDALLSHAEMLESAAYVLREIASHLGTTSLEEVEIEADCHFITLTLPENVANVLLDKELVCEPEEEDCD